MKAGDAGRLHSWLADPSVVDVDPVAVGRVRARLARTDEPLPVTLEPHGTLVVREPSSGNAPPRRVLEFDRDGTLLSALRWTDEGRLERAWTRIADGSWVMIEPHATHEPGWGPCDRLWHAGHPSAAAPVPLTFFEALAYERIDRIPALADPARLPPGAGTAVLNLVAALALDVGCTGLAYRGPYPTEQLFLALLESFRYHTDQDDPLAAFMDGGVEWSPAPHERVCLASGMMVHLRERVEKVAWRRRVYYRPDWQDIQRHAPRRVRDADGTVICSLWALGGVVEDHLRLDPEGTAAEVLIPDSRILTAPTPLPRAVAAAVVSAAAALGAAPLAPFVRQIAATCELVWAHLDGDLVAIEGTRLLVSWAVHETLARRLGAATTRAERLTLGLATITELAHLFGDTLRTLAQSHIATLPPTTQARLLTEAPPTVSGPDDATRITEGIEALIADTMTNHP